jgi:hypothetical protein
MSEIARTRRGVALIAAYVVALQALLLPLSVAAGPFAGSLCASVNGSPSPVSHEQGCPCAAGCGMQCCAQTLAGPPQIVIALGPTRTIVIAPAPVIQPVVRVTERGPQVARAPPVA